MLLTKNQILILFMLCSLRLVAGYDSELHNDTEISNVTCWYEGIQEPCSSLEIALEGLA